VKLTTAQIGLAGELLVQEQLLLHGIESAPLTTDTGIDLVAYSPRRSDGRTYIGFACGTRSMSGWQGGA
jgi:hypothetical protein